MQQEYFSPLVTICMANSTNINTFYTLILPSISTLVFPFTSVTCHHGVTYQPGVTCHPWVTCHPGLTCHPWVTWHPRELASITDYDTANMSLQVLSWWLVGCWNYFCPPHSPPDPAETLVLPHFCPGCENTFLPTRQSTLPIRQKEVERINTTKEATNDMTWIPPWDEK